MKRYLILAAGIFLLAGIAWWWDHGWQAWWAVQTGTDNCVNIPAPYLNVCKHYGFWSGFGSVMPWTLLTMSGLFSALWVIVRHHNCHEPGCWRVGRVHVDDKGTLSCWHHHPDGRPQRGHIAAMHAAHLLRKAGP